MTRRCDIPGMLCLCGCGTEIPIVDKGYSKREGYAHNHHRKGKSSTWLVKPDDEIDEFTCRRRARKLKAHITSCEWEHIGDCKGPLEVAHIDQDPWNNNVENLIKLCACHHRLMDNGKIDPTDPVMPSFYISSGKRRYHR